eukprot:gene12951-21916_t
MVRADAAEGNRAACRCGGPCKVVDTAGTRCAACAGRKIGRPPAGVFIRTRADSTG